MEVDNLIQSFSEFKDVKNIDRETMMNILKRIPVPNGRAIIIG